MIARFATKRDNNGNRYYLIVDHTNKEYTRQPAHWYDKADYIEVSKTDRRKLETLLDNNGYRETEKAL